MKKQVVNGLKSGAPLIIALTVCTVCAHAQMPLDRYSANADQVTNSVLLRRIAGVAIGLVGLALAMRSHDINKSAVVGVAFGVGLLINADAVISWLS